MAHDVFLSYSYQDKASADAVCHSLEAKGVRCWIAPRDVVPGADWQQSILDAIAGSRAVILIFTSHTNQSENVKKEVSAAFDAAAMVIPFRIEDVTPQGSLKYHLIGVHWLDAYAPPLEEHISHLAKIIQNLPPQGAGGPPTPGPDPIPIPLPLPPPPPPPGPASEPARWDDVSLDRREGFAFLAAIVPFAPGLYLLWRKTYRADGDKVATVSQPRKIGATVLAALIIALLLGVGVHLARSVGAPPSPVVDSSAASGSPASSAASAESSSASASSAAPAGWAAASGDGKDRQVKFVNRTNHAVWHLYAWSTDSQESDAHDVMPESDVIIPGDFKSYTIDDGAAHCDYNFKVTRADNAPPLYASNVDVCGINTYTFTE